MQLKNLHVVVAVRVVPDASSKTVKKRYISMEFSPMMQQYNEIKKQNEGKILFFRLGDFYEMFFSDALLVSKELNLTLTKRDCGQNERAPMCGVPYHSAQAYIARLIKKGYKVAICDQIGPTADAKGLVKREVTQIITPGTVMESNMLDESENNFLACIYQVGESYGFAVADISTGEMKAVKVSSQNRLIDELGRFTPNEVIFNEGVLSSADIGKYLKQRIVCTSQLIDDILFEDASKNLLSHLKAVSLEDIGFYGEQSVVVCASAALLQYVYEMQKMGIKRINEIELYSENQYMNLSANTIRNLELVKTINTSEKKGSLIGILDKTRTAFGCRLLKQMIDLPLVDAVNINKRLNAVEEIFSNLPLRNSIDEMLKHINDFERISTKITYGTVNPRELKGLENTIRKFALLKAIILRVKSAYLIDIEKNIDPLEDMTDIIYCAILDEETPSNLKDNPFKLGYNDELDEYRDLLLNSKKYLAKIEADEKEATGIKKLKISYNKVFGYCIEISNSNKDSVPDRYIRKQTLSNCERYITQDLKKLEEKIFYAQEAVEKLSLKLYDELKDKLSVYLGRIKQTANAIAKLDVINCFANIAYSNHYVRPHINMSDKLVIVDGRHPVIEQIMTDAPFVPNDTTMDCGENQVAILTGPNMAGKSTYMRQIALIVLMAQIGCFVPAKSADIGIVDGIYTRVGASDDLASGRSTFMMEMTEVSQILKSATNKSLLVLDEIGRGTSTFDGMSIARAVIEYIADKRKLGAKTLFATHYHELTDLEETLSSVKNYNIAAKKRGTEILFLRRIVRGGTDDSYGIEVSKLAGIPNSIINRAYKILGSLEAGKAVEKPLNIKKEVVQQTIISSQVEDILENIDVNTLTPIEALTKLYELKAMCTGGR